MKKIAIVCGGYSGEYEISISSAKVVKKHLDSSQYESYIIVVLKDRWYHLADDGKETDVDKSDFSIKVGAKKVVFDAVFNAIHGVPGEDGQLLGYFEMLGIPYTSSGFTTSALTFHKDFCKKIAAAAGANVSPSIIINKGESYDGKKIIKELGLPLFVKPTRNGSSVGVSKVNVEDDFDKAVEFAFKAGDQVMCEKFVKGRELACTVMQVKGKTMVFPVTEIVSKNDFFDYEAKYTAGKSDEITPADLDEVSEIEVKATSAMLYDKFECRGFARFDYIMTPKQLVFIEVNIVPGMSEASIMPKQAACMGITLDKLFDLALEN
ncbi:MAG: D-alanine--D-alanine ligase, partial [Bacteroidales bacterium]|nr:D-alanine--D-alanine ligase [Bacteroidales bacterium]